MRLRSSSASHNDKKAGNPALIDYYLYALIIILYLWFFSQYWEQEGTRAKDLRDFAAKIGFAFQDKDDELEAFLLKKTSCFSRSIRARITKCLSKKNEVIEIKVADCYYSSRALKVYRSTICLIIDKKMNLPHFLLRSEHRFFDGILRFFGMQDIKFSDDQAFSKTFVLQSKDEIGAKYLFTDEVRKFMMKYGDARTQIEGHGSMLLLFTSMQYVSDFENMVNEARQICTLLKKTVEKEGLND